MAGPSITYICKDLSKVQVYTTKQNVSTSSTSENVLKYKYKCFWLKRTALVITRYLGAVCN